MAVVTRRCHSAAEVVGPRGWRGDGGSAAGHSVAARGAPRRTASGQAFALAAAFLAFLKSRTFWSDSPSTTSATER